MPFSPSVSLTSVTFWTTCWSCDWPISKFQWLLLAFRIMYNLFIQIPSNLTPIYFSRLIFNSFPDSWRFCFSYKRSSAISRTRQAPLCLCACVLVIPTGKKTHFFSCLVNFKFCYWDSTQTRSLLWRLPWLSITRLTFLHYISLSFTCVSPIVLLHQSCFFMHRPPDKPWALWG